MGYGTYVNHMSNPWTYLEVKKSIFKVTRPINVVRDNASYAHQVNSRDTEDENESIFQ